MENETTYKVQYKDGTSISFEKLNGVRKVQLKKYASANEISAKMIESGFEIVKLPIQSQYLLFEIQASIKGQNWSQKEKASILIDTYFSTIGKVYGANNYMYLGQTSLVLIPFDNLTSQEVASKLGSKGTIKHNLENCFVVEYESETIMKDKVNELNLEEWVELADPNFSNLSEIPIDRKRNIQDAHRFINMKLPPQDSHDILNAKDRIKGKASVKIAIFDTGIDHDHYDLKDALQGQPHYDAISWDNNPYPYNRNSHGTLCAGIAAAQKKYESGVNGIGYGCSISDYRICYHGKNTGGIYKEFHYDLYSMINAFNKAAFVDKVDVISCSWGVGQKYKTLEKVLKNVSEKGREAKGLPIVFSAGNGENNVSFPANSSYVITVAAVDRSKQPIRNTIIDGIEYFGSNFGENVDLAAVGTDIITTDMLAHYGRVSASIENFNYDKKFRGTSAAAPQVAGCIGLMLSKNNKLSFFEIKDLLTDKCNLSKFKTKTKKNYGVGILNVAKVLSKINVT